MKKTQIISFCITKGGTGKSTSAINIGTALQQFGKKVAILDFDQQADICIGFGIDPEKLDKTIMDVVTGNCSINDVIISTQYSVSIIPSNKTLSEFDMLILNNLNVFKQPAFVLKNIMQTLVDANTFDYILIDLPPSENLQLINALTASTGVIVPMQCEYFSVKGVTKALETIHKVKQNYNPDLNLIGIIATMFDRRANICSVVLQEARKELGNAGIKVFENTIYKTIKFSDSTMLGMPAILCFPENENVQDYISLTKEVFNID